MTIGTNVTSIGDRAFEYCTSLPSVTIPNSVTSIGDYAFQNCPSLTSVTIGTNVASIGDYAFESCSLTSVTIPNSVTNIGVSPFASCTSLTAITLAAQNPAYSTVNGVLFDKSQATLLEFPGGLGGSYTIPGSVTSIGEAAFEFCSSLTGVTIPNSVTNVGDYAFVLCSSLTSVMIPNSVTSIGYDAFDSCSGLTSVTIPNSVTSIGDYAFEFCSGLASAYFLGNAPPDYGYAFYGDPATVYYLAGTTGWGSTFGSVPAVLWDPQANTFSFTGGQFGFNLTGPTNAVIVVEACTDLSHPRVAARQHQHLVRLGHLRIQRSSIRRVSDALLPFPLAPDSTLK